MMVKYESRYGFPLSRAKTGDVGHDLHVVIRPKDVNFIDWLFSFGKYDRIVIWPFTQRTLSSGIKIEKPDSIWALIKERSSTLKRNMFVMGGVIDSGYRGEYKTIIRNMGLIPRIVQNGDRLAQVIFLNAVRPETKIVWHIDKNTERGDDGFGSSGR